MAGSEGPRGTLAVHADAAGFAVDTVLFYFCYIVAYVIDKLHVQIPLVATEHCLKCFAHPVADDLAVGKRIIGSAGHGSQITFSFR